MQSETDLERKHFADEAGRSQRFVREYFHSSLCDHFGNSRRIAILCDGCGVGGEVEQLRALGYSAFGIDSGYRRHAWKFRSAHDRLLVADGIALPFQSNRFDVVLSFGVLDHVGEEDLHRGDPEAAELKRRAFVSEALRVLKHGGIFVTGSIHRWCPIDPFHDPNFMGVRMHGPGDLHSISFGQIRRWCRQSGIAHAMKTLPFDHRVFAWENQSWIRTHLGLVDLLFGREDCAWMRRTPLNPFLLVKVTRTHRHPAFSRITQRSFSEAAFPIESA